MVKHVPVGDEVGEGVLLLMDLRRRHRWTAGPRVGRRVVDLGRVRPVGGVSGVAADGDQSAVGELGERRIPTGEVHVGDPGPLRCWPGRRCSCRRCRSDRWTARRSPPTTMTRPSGSCTAPSQNTLSGALIVVNVPGVAGFQTHSRLGLLPAVPRQELPLFIRMLLRATIGHRLQRRPLALRRRRSASRDVGRRRCHAGAVWRWSR